MKKKPFLAVLTCSLLLLLTSCDEVLSVVTVGEDGKKVVNSYISMGAETVYDESVTLKSWRDANLFNSKEIVKMNNLIFKIEDKERNIVVFGDKEAAVEIAFFDGGYKYKVFVSADTLSKAFSGAFSL